jgi:hypothetical protein
MGKAKLERDVVTMTDMIEWIYRQEVDALRIASDTNVTETGRLSFRGHADGLRTVRRRLEAMRDDGLDRG